MSDLYDLRVTLLTSQFSLSFSRKRVRVPDFPPRGSIFQYHMLQPSPYSLPKMTIISGLRHSSIHSPFSRYEISISWFHVALSSRIPNSNYNIWLVLYVYYLVFLIKPPKICCKSVSKYVVFLLFTLDGIIFSWSKSDQINEITIFNSHLTINTKIASDLILISILHKRCQTPITFKLCIFFA